MLSKISTLKSYGSTMRAKVGAFLYSYAHITYTVRVVLALCIGLAGVASVYALASVENLGALRSALTAAVAGTEVIEEEPIVVSGVLVEGEVVPARELALSAHASGIVIDAPHVGERVGEGDVVTRIENAAALRAVRAAEVALGTARLSADMNRRASALALSSDTTARSDASFELSQALATGWDEAGEILPSLPDVISGLSGILYGGGGFDDDENALVRHAGIIEADDESISPLIARAADGYVEAKRAYENAYALYHTETTPNNTEREMLVTTTADMLQTLSNALRATEQLFSFIKNHRTALGYQTPSVFESYEDTLANYQEQIDNQLSVIEGTRTLVEAAQAVIEGETPTLTSPESAELDIQRAELELDEARALLTSYDVRAPFAGNIARVDTRSAEYVSDGENVALLVSDVYTVRVYLAQGEAARVKVGTRVLVSVGGTDITVPAVVEEMDVVGEKNEDGLVVFGAVITFPKPDERLKPGMQVLVGFEIDEPKE